MSEQDDSITRGEPLACSSRGGSMAIEKRLASRRRIAIGQSASAVATGVAPLTVWLAGAPRTTPGSLLGYVAAVSVSVVALFVIQLMVGLHFRDGGPMVSVIAVVAGVAVWASAIVLATAGSSVVVVASVASGALFFSAMRASSSVHAAEGGQTVSHPTIDGRVDG